MKEVKSYKKKWMFRGMHKLADELTEDFLTLNENLQLLITDDKSRDLRRIIDPIEKRILKALNGEWIDGTAYQKGYEAGLKEATK